MTLLAWIALYAAAVVGVGYLTVRLFAVGKHADRMLDDGIGRDESEGAHGR